MDMLHAVFCHSTGTDTVQEIEWTAIVSQETPCGQPVSFDLTRAVKRWLQHPEDNLGVVVKVEDRQERGEGGLLGKLTCKWEDGIFLGVKGSTGEMIVGTEKGIWRTRTVRRCPKEERLSAQSLDEVNFAPLTFTGARCSALPVYSGMDYRLIKHLSSSPMASS